MNELDPSMRGDGSFMVESGFWVFSSEDDILVVYLWWRLCGDEDDNDDSGVNVTGGRTVR